MDLANLRTVIRGMVYDQPDRITSSIPWHATDTFRHLSPAQQTSVRALARALQDTHGDIGALLPAQPMAEWC